MSIIEDYIYDTEYISEEDKLREFTIEGKWDEVMKLYESDPKFSTIKINKSRGTALHVAVNDTPLHFAAAKDVVRNLVDSIISHKNETVLECITEKGDTPLHLAASKGFIDTCEYIVGKNGERKYLIDIKNKDGETPLFLAALSWHKQTFVYLSNYKQKESDFEPSGGDDGNYSYYKDLIRKNGDSILHCAIEREFFGIPVANLNVEEAVEYYSMKQYDSSTHNKCPKNYDTCYLFLQKCYLFVKRHLMKETTSTAAYESENCQHHNIPMQSEHKLLPENYATCLLFMKLAWIYILSGIGVEEITKMKQKHKWSDQLLKRFMEKPYESYLGTGAKSTQHDIGIAGNNYRETEETTSISEMLLESETAILTATRNGIVEMVEELITKIPSSIYDVNVENKNVLLVAVENRRSIVVEALRKRLEDVNKKVIFDNLIQGTDMEENTMLHLAATISDPDWHISGPALKVMWHIKWFEFYIMKQYTKGLVPEHFIDRRNIENKTAGELFKNSIATLVPEGSKWFKSISDAGSVVAVLLAGVAFATSSTMPGGNKSDTGEPILKGKPVFDTFAISSVIGLCFSVSALIMFLSIINSQKEANDFRIDLPGKLLYGLSSLFLSMVALFVASCSSNFFVIDDKFKHIVFLFYSVTCFPLTLYAVSELPLYIKLLRGIFAKVPKTSDKEKGY